MARNTLYQQAVTFLCVMVLLMGFIFISNFSQTKSSVLIHAQSFRFPDAELEFNRNYSEYLERLGFNDYEEVSVTNGFPEFTIVTGFSSNHAPEGRNMIVNASQTLPGKRIVVYGMDLSDNEKQWFKNACNVDYRDFNLSDYPKHVAPANYRFKPLIIAEALKEFGSIMWADTSTIFTGKPISDFLKELEEIKNNPEEPQVYLLGYTGHTTYAATQPDMYKFLTLTNSTLNGKLMSPAGKSLFVRTKATMEKALKWYVLCALEEECMAPRAAQLWCKPALLWKGKYAKCHRYDQSAINLILTPYNNSYLSANMTDLFCVTERGITVNETAVVSC